MKAFHISLILGFLTLSVMFAIADESRSYGELETISPMITPRYNHTSTVLGDLVLVCGGTSDGRDSLSSCELLDPSTGNWMEVAPTEIPRMRHTSTLLENGSVVIAGGFIGGGYPSLIRDFNGSGNRSLDSCEIFDPVKGSWSKFPSLMSGRFWHAELLHPDLGLMVLGGMNITSGALSSCEVFSEGKWVSFPPLPVPLVRFALCILKDGDILVAGGHDGMEKRSSPNTYRYDIDSGSWSEVSPMLHGRGYPGYCLLEDGRFVVSGGFSDQGSPDRSDAEVYDPDTDVWSEFGILLFPRHGHGLVEVSGQCLVMAGGSNCETGGCHSNIEIFDLSSGNWVDSGHLIIGRKWCGVNLVNGNTVVVTGGKACNYPTADTDVLRFRSTDDQIDPVHADIDPVVWTLVPLILTILTLVFFLYLRKGSG